MLELKCPQIESSEYLCDRTAGYQIDGTIYCAHRARQLMELKTQKKDSTNTKSTMWHDVLLKELEINISTQHRLGWAKLA